MGVYQIIFLKYRGWAEGKSGVAFTGIAIGVLSTLATANYSNRLHLKLERKHTGDRYGVMWPEGRLPMAMVAAILLPGAIFWFAWTGYRVDVHWIVPVISGVMLELLTLFHSEKSADRFLV